MAWLSIRHHVRRLKGPHREPAGERLHRAGGLVLHQHRRAAPATAGAVVTAIPKSNGVGLKLVMSLQVLLAILLLTVLISREVAATS